MNVRQEAHGLIERMREDSIRALIPVMVKMIPFKTKKTAEQTAGVFAKMQAFLDMQEMRKSSVKYNFSEAQRDAAIEEKTV